MVTLQVCDFATFSGTEGFSLWAAEYATETSNEAIGTPEVQFGRYKELDEKGSLRCVAVLEDGYLVGGAVLMVTSSQHYAFPIVGVDSIYLRIAYRKGRTGVDLLNAVKAVAKREGAPGMTFMAPPGSNLDKLCACLGMVNTHKAYWCNV